MNDNWLVEVAPHRFFLKHRHPNLGCPEIVRSQHDLMRHLQRTGFPAPALVPNVQGQSLTVMDGDCYELQHYIEGDPFDPSWPEHLAAAAVTLGRYHTLVEGFVPLALSSGGDLFHPTTARTNLTRLARAWDSVLAEPLDSLILTVEQQIKGLGERFAAQEPLPRLVIHGDYYAENLLFNGDRICGVVDYDRACWQPRVVEMAEALIYFAAPRSATMEHLVYPGPLDWERLTEFLRYYGHMVIPGESEVQALSDYIECIWLQVSLCCLLTQNPERPDNSCQALEEVLALSLWARDNASRIAEVARTAVRSSYV